MTKKNKVYFKFKIGKKEYGFSKGKWWDVFHGVICGIVGVMLISIIVSITGYQNKYFFIGFGTLFGMIISVRTSKLWIKLTKRWR